MTDYKPGDKVEYLYIDTWLKGVFALGPHKGSISNGPAEPMALITIGNGDLHRHVRLSELRHAPPEPEWEYGRQSRVGGATLWHSFICEDLQYRRQVGKPETIEYLTPEQVEELRND